MRAAGEVKPHQFVVPGEVGSAKRETSKLWHEELVCVGPRQPCIERFKGGLELDRRIPRNRLTLLIGKSTGHSGVGCLVSGS